MCGIVGYTGHREAYPIIINGLKRLEYRGYDSTGVALVNNGLKVYKKKAGLRILKKQILAKICMHILASGIQGGLLMASQATGMLIHTLQPVVNWQ